LFANPKLKTYDEVVKVP